MTTHRRLGGGRRARPRHSPHGHVRHRPRCRRWCSCRRLHPLWRAGGRHRDPDGLRREHRARPSTRISAGQLSARRG